MITSSLQQETQPVMYMCTLSVTTGDILHDLSHTHMMQTSKYTHTGLVQL
jgi:hypothetical protein